MKRSAWLLVTLLALAVGASAQGLAIGGTMENFSLPDTTGKTQTLDGLKGTKGAVVIFLSAQCPVVKAYNQRISEIANDYKAKGINFIGINSNVTESGDWVKSNAAENYKFPVLIDKNNILADKLGAMVTPEAYYVDANRALVYHGAIDNDRSATNITEPYLRNAFDLSLAGQKVGKTTARAFGCNIKRVGD
jgi:peroxiredoxin